LDIYRNGLATRSKVEKGVFIEEAVILRDYYSQWQKTKIKASCRYRLYFDIV